MSVTCLIPAAGKGTRVRPLSNTLPKAMLTIAGKPTIYHIIDSVVQAGIKDFVIITGYLKELMESEILAAYPQLNIRFVRQEEQKGLGHACFLAREEIPQEESLLIVYGDTLFEADLKNVLQKEHSQIGVYAVEDPRRFGIVGLDEQKKFISKFVEKPDKPTSNLAIPGVNFFVQAKPLFDALEYIINADIKTKNEYQITDAFSRMLEIGHNMETFLLDAWYDAGTLDAIFDTNRILLKKYFELKHGEPLNSQEQKDNINDIRVKKDKHNNNIIEPVFIHPSASVYYSNIGPYTSISADAKIFESTISNSIIDKGSVVEQSMLYNSLCGRNVKVKNIDGKLILGDDAVALSEN